MDDRDIIAIRARLAVVTPGNWRVGGNGNGIDPQVISVKGIGVIAKCYGIVRGAPGTCVANATFIAYAKDDVAQLLALVGARGHKLVAAKRALECARDTIHSWHGDVAWGEYQASPEMKRINAALKEIGE